jgi:hypothetical protein
MASVRRFSRLVESDSPVVQRLAKSPAVQHPSKSREDATEPIWSSKAQLTLVDWMVREVGFEPTNP